MVTYEDYDKLCSKFRESNNTPENVSSTYEITEAERRLIWLSLAASKAQLKEYDPKKGLNQ